MTEQTGHDEQTGRPEPPKQSRVVRDDAENRYEIWYGDALAGFTQYTERGNQTIFIHTEIGDAFGGKGLGTVLARNAVEDVIARGRQIVPQCPFIAAFLDKHPEYEEHVQREGREGHEHS